MKKFIGWVIVLAVIILIVWYFMNRGPKMAPAPAPQKTAQEVYNPGTGKYEAFPAPKDVGTVGPSLSR